MALIYGSFFIFSWSSTGCRTGLRTGSVIIHNNKINPCYDRVLQYLFNHYCFTFTSIKYPLGIFFSVIRILGQEAYLKCEIDFCFSRQCTRQFQIGLFFSSDWYLKIFLSCDSEMKFINVSTYLHSPSIFVLPACIPPWSAFWISN